jgi:hypothetical protein
VFVGWNLTKDVWLEPLMIAGPCANGFRMNPDNVQKINELFTELKLANAEEHPVVFKNTNVPDEQVYPKLAKRLVIEYHKNNITDLEKAGVEVIIDPMPKKTKKAKK